MYDDQDRLDRLLDALLALPTGARAAFLEQACPDDPALRARLASLAAHAAREKGFLERSPLALPADKPAVTPYPGALVAGQRFGAFRLERRLGTGGRSRATVRIIAAPTAH
jgi:eukaryotic-like serine/threonine-protein kinase